MRYKYHSGPKVDFNYELLKNVAYWPSEFPAEYVNDMNAKEVGKLAILKTWYEPFETNSKLSIDLAAESLKEFNIDIAIEILKTEWGVESVCDTAGIIFSGNGTELATTKSLIPHLHVPNPTYNNKYAPTITVIMPIRVVEPVIEEFCNVPNIHIDWDQYDADDFFYRNALASLSLDLLNKVDVHSATRIPYPKEGEYLVIEFDGKTDYHWVENLTNNHYLYLVVNSHYPFNPGNSNEP
jgi:hypothetical protein